jgi:hypothetical protein
VPSEICSIEEQSLKIVDGRVVTSSDVVRISTMLLDVMPKHVGATIRN